MKNQNQALSSKIQHKLFNLKSFLLVLELIDTKINEVIKVKPQDIPQYVTSEIHLEAFAFELIIKIFYELDLREEAPKTHNIEDLFKELNKENRNFIKNTFHDDINKKLRTFHDNINKKLRKLHKNLDVYMPDFEEVLKNNSEIVMNFKYTSKLPNASIVSLSFLRVLYKELVKRSKNKKYPKCGMVIYSD